MSSIALASLYGFVAGRVWLRAGLGTRLAISLAMLAAVWTMNFLVVLPWLNPAFTALLPLGVTFVSKLLFAFWSVFAALSWSPRMRTGTGVMCSSAAS